VNQTVESTKDTNLEIRVHATWT